MSRWRIHAALIAGVTLLALIATGATQAAKVYRWTDRNGVVHYGDRPPANVRPEQIKRIPVRAEPGAIARLRVEGDGQQYLAYADNALAGPIEVMLHAGNSTLVFGDPPLPARATVPARGSTLVARIGSADPSRGGEFQLQLRSVPGDPSARPRDVEYGYPLQSANLHVAQGYGGGFSHNDAQNRHAVDLAAPIGTPVVAAREGVVMQVESDFDKASLNREQYGGRANFVRILHDDGTMGLYAHLKPEGVLVRVGQRVRRAQAIGLSGNTGFSGGPHLHFVVQVNRGMKLESIPFKMFGPQGILRLSEPRASARP
ncbi:M23 family metallopeptidase [Luteimonas vadosa]|uniref:M23 family metallopeptidase n=1 Tax=Luteimonas vadosa TaxID=1165507 RepID=A0ABP9DWX3_9GAMM